MSVNCVCARNDVVADDQPNRQNAGTITLNKTLREEDLLKSLLGSFLIGEIKSVVQGIGKAIETVSDSSLSEIEDLKDRIKSQEDYITCLEEQVRELQDFVREKLVQTSTSLASSNTDRQVNRVDYSEGARVTSPQSKRQEKKSWLPWSKPLISPIPAPFEEG
jgi:hypothetical protein